jgi:SpoVK/Ycf46/Vps4 family AAA+-type ATPase
MVQYRGNFELADFDVKQFDVDIETHYNDDFIDSHNIISSSLKSKNNNGIILLHGKYGTGKTYYLRHLINNVDRKFIYFPLNMIGTINSPEFLPFLSEQPNSVLILEDCESLLVHRDSGSSNASALSNLLNLGDGLLSDALSVNVICTFNAGIKKIDDAILRKGRLIARYEFKELELQKAQKLAQQIGKNVNIDHPMTVSDIYNIDEKNFENTKSKAIGFKAA